MKRKKPHSSALVLLLVLIFGAWWGVSVLGHYSRVGTQITARGPEVPMYTQQHPLEISLIQTGNTLTYVGSFALPACELLGSGISVDGNPKQVSLKFVSTKASVACAQAATYEKNPFSLSVDLTDNNSLPVFWGVTLNGVKVPSILVATN